MANTDRLIEVLNEATGLAAGPERETYLDSVCAGNAEFRAQICSLLDASEEAGPFLGESMLSVARLMPVDTPGERIGDRIGRYKLLRQIGEGGCGVVYMAAQEEPVRRLVALKVIKLGMDTKEV